VSGFLTSRASSRRHAPFVERLEGRDLPASFLGLGPGTSVADVSADGSVVFGADSAGGFRWTSSAGIAYLPAAVQPFSLFGVAAGAISADGSTVVGPTKAPGEYRVGSWSAATGLIDTGIAAGSAFGVSADGKIVVSYRTDPNNPSGPDVNAFFWTNGGGAQAVAPGYRNSIAQSISADGVYIAGTATLTSHGLSFAYRWSVGTGLVDLGYEGTAHALTADGSTVVGGRFKTGVGDVPLTWDAAAHEVDLGLPTGLSQGVALDISGDGKLIVGAGGGDGDGTGLSLGGRPSADRGQGSAPGAIRPGPHRLEPHSRDSRLRRRNDHHRQRRRPVGEVRGLGCAPG
jgi:uncharacterized membrane protein